ncbi:MAG TPA: OmpA family protein [Stellaceae bacterium]|nr:OmpA family protein [Stellaceae bacterium]
MLNHRTMLGLASVGILLAACTQSRPVPADTSGKATIFTDGYVAMQNGNDVEARNDFEQAYSAAPNDPYHEEDLAATYQNTGDLRQALPLYRHVIATAGDVYPTHVTRPEVQGMSVAQVAEWNLKMAGIDQYGNAIQPEVQSQAAALAAPAERTWQVFFNFDRSDLTPQALQTIREASNGAKSGDLTRISLTGHTDSVGTDAYNMRLSDQRARSVQQALEADGIAQGDIVVRGVGKAGQMVPTPAGVREPQNRRVEIVEEKALVD